MEEQKMDRKGYIGGSDIAVVMGLSPWKTPLRLYSEKIGDIEPEDLSDKEYVLLGTELEDFVSKKFERRYKKDTGKEIKVRRDTRTFRHPEHEYLVAHIDRRIVGTDAILEAKTASAYKVDAWEGDEIPTPYVLQCIWYMGITKMHKCYIAVLIGGQKFVWKKVEWDEELFETMVERAVQFMDMVEKKEPPTVVYGDKDTLSTLYPQSEEKIAELSPEQEELVNETLQERNAHLQILKDVKEELEVLENKVKENMGECDTIVTDVYRCTWKTQSRRNADAGKMKEDGIFDKYVKVSTFRKFNSTKKVQKET